MRCPHQSNIGPGQRHQTLSNGKYAKNYNTSPESCVPGAVPEANVRLIASVFSKQSEFKVVTFSKSSRVISLL